MGWLDQSLVIELTFNAMGDRIYGQDDMWSFTWSTKYFIQTKL